MFRDTLRLLAGSAFAVAAAAVPALADPAWDQSMSRGLSIYHIEAGDNAATLTCDPERVFGGRSNGSLQVVLAGQKVSGQIVLLSEDGHQAAFQMKDGLAPQYDADAKEWDRMIAALAKGGSYAFVTSAESWRLDNVEPLPKLDCK